MPAFCYERHAATGGICDRCRFCQLAHCISTRSDRSERPASITTPNLSTCSLVSPQRKVIVMSDPRDEFIAQVVAGQTFVDVGGLWNTVSEKISVAHEHGAIELTMIDIAPPEDQQWIDFANRLQQLGVDPGIVTCLSKDVLSVVEADRKFSATRPCGSKGIGGCDVSMKLC